MIYAVHHTDTDGFGSAFAFWSFLKTYPVSDEITYIPANYGQPFPLKISNLTKEDFVYIMDISYHRNILDEVNEKVLELKVFDHHKTAKEELVGSPYAVVDLTKSGATLTWQELTFGKEPPLFLKYVEDFDLWKFALPCSREINFYINSLPQNFEVWKQESEKPVEYWLERGIPIAAFVDNIVLPNIKGNAKIFTMMGHKVVSANVIYPFISEGGMMLCREFPECKFSLTYCDDLAHGLRRWSLRSIGDFDVSTIAANYGGGGHKNSSGFTTPMLSPF